MITRQEVLQNKVKYRIIRIISQFSHKIPSNKSFGLPTAFGFEVKWIKFPIGLYYANISEPDNLKLGVLHLN